VEDDNDIEAEIDDDTGEVRVRPAPAAPPPAPPQPRVSSPRANGSGNGSARRERTGVGATAQQTPSTQAAPPPAQAEPPDAKNAPWSSNHADLVWDEMNGGEHPRCLAKLGKSAFDTKIVVAHTVAGARHVVDSMQGSEVMGGGDVSPGEALRQRAENKHMVVTDAPCTYDVSINWKPGGTFYGRGLVLSFPSRGEIVATRGVTRSAQGGAGYGQIPQQQPYQPAAPMYGAPQPPQPQSPPAGYGAPPAQPAYMPNPSYPQQPMHDPEVSNLRTEVAGLAGAVKGMMDYMREEREYARGERQRPPTPPQAPQAPPAQPQQGFGAAPQHQQPWPRRPGYERSEADELRDELDDLRAELNALHRRGSGAPGGPGFGQAPAQAVVQPAAHVPPPPPPAPRGPNGEIWVESARAWCMPVGMQPAAAAAQPAAAPVQATAPVQAPAPAARTGVGAATEPFSGVETQFRNMVADMQATVMKRVAREMNSALSGMQTGLGQAEEEPEPAPPPEPESTLPFDVIDMPGQDLWGHPLKYAASKETGRIDLEGFVMSNPGVLEKGAEVLGALVEIGSTFAKRAAQATTMPRAASSQLPAAAGVGQSPATQAQVVENIPEEAQHATASNGAGSGSFPAV